MTTFSTPRASRTHAATIDPANLPALIAGQRTAMVYLDDAARAAAETGAPGDSVYIDAGQICAGARVLRVDTFDNLTAHDLRLLRETHGARTVGDGSAWTARPDATTATVVWLSDVRPMQDRTNIPADLRTPSMQTWRTSAEPTTATHRQAA